MRCRSAPWARGGLARRTPACRTRCPRFRHCAEAKRPGRRMRRGFLDDFVMQFDHRFAEHLQHGRPAGGQVVISPPPCPFSDSGFGSEPPVAFQALQEWIERAGADVVAVPAQLGEDPLPDDRMLGGVMENVDLPEAQQDLTGEQFRVMRGHRRHLLACYYDGRKRQSEYMTGCPCVTTAATTTAGAAGSTSGPAAHPRPARTNRHTAA